MNALSDGPITSEEEDILQFQIYANALADFIRRKSTTTPLTVGIDAPWGHGKSSLMNLMVKELQRSGIRRVKVTMKAPVVSPVMAPATRNPLLNPDWMVRLGHRYLKQSILEGAQKGQTSDLHSTHPVPGIIFSSEFGEGAAGRY